MARENIQRDARRATLEGNEEVVRRFLNEAWGRRDMDAALACAHPEIEIDWSNSMAPFGGTYTGYDGLVRFWTSLWEAWEQFRPVIEEVIELGHDRFITVNLIRARGKGSGIEVESRGAALWTMRDTKIAAVKLFQGKDEALQALGLKE
jgi:ketosteroid isomerase-like protein